MGGERWGREATFVCVCVWVGGGGVGVLCVCMLVKEFIEGLFVRVLSVHLSGCSHHVCVGMLVSLSLSLSLSLVLSLAPRLSFSFYTLNMQSNLPIILSQYESTRG